MINYGTAVLLVEDEASTKNSQMSWLTGAALSTPVQSSCRSPG